MKIEKILSKLEGVKKSGDQWIAQCPAHDDHKPSLSLTESSDGSILVHCFAGCTFDEVVKAIGLGYEIFFPEEDKDTKQKIVASYDYVDEEDKLLYRKLRWTPKGFTVQQASGRNDLRGVKKVLYRLPAIINADGWVFVCEGEKSVEAIVGLGLNATTAPFPTGKWLSSYSKSLQGKRVCILPDNDSAGERYAGKASSSLLGVVKELRIVKLPAVGIKSDPYDWVEIGGTKEKLLDLVNQSPNLDEVPLYWSEDNAPTFEDYVKALQSLGYEFRLNISNDVVEINEEPINDIARARLRTEMCDLNYRAVSRLEDAWITHAADNSYHPVRDYLEKLGWDGKDYIAKLAEYFKDDLDFFHLFLRRWLVGAVARAYRRCQNRMFVLDGTQGIGKSYFVRWLISGIDRPELFIEGPINPEDKDDKTRLITAWIWEVSELGSTTRKSDRDALKYFLSSQQVTVRKPYGHYDMVKPALSSFIGTINNTGGFLSDPTGYRRFMSVHLDEINWEYIKDVDPDQIWAQAKALYDEGENWELAGDEVDCAQLANERFEIDDPLESIIYECFEITRDWNNFTATEEIRMILHNKDWRLKSPIAESMAIANTMKKLRLRKGDKGRDQGKKIRGYRGIKILPN